MQTPLTKLTNNLRKLEYIARFSGNDPVTLFCAKLSVSTRPKNNRRMDVLATNVYLLHGTKYAKLPKESLQHTDSI